MTKSDPTANHSLKHVDLFRGLSPAALRKAEEGCAWRTYKPGECIFEYLDRSDDVFFISAGEARVIIYSATGKPVSFTDVGSGDMFGEYPAIDGLSRSASVEALRV
jgi:CRP-like cAMP-binding protein